MQTVLVRIPLEKRWDEILEFFNHDEKLTVVAGTVLSDHFQKIRICPHYSDLINLGFDTQQGFFA